MQNKKVRLATMGKKAQVPKPSCHPSSLTQRKPEDASGRESDLSDDQSEVSSVVTPLPSSTGSDPSSSVNRASESAVAFGSGNRASGSGMCASSSVTRASESDFDKSARSFVECWQACQPEGNIAARVAQWADQTDDCKEKDSNIHCRRHSEGALGWVNPKAHSGLLMEGECFIRAIRQVKEMKMEDKIDTWNYYGMFSRSCSCPGCVDRRKRYDREQPVQQSKKKREVEDLESDCADTLLRHGVSVVAKKEKKKQFDSQQYPVKPQIERDIHFRLQSDLPILNPKFSELNEVVAKIKKYGTETILLVPDWKSERFYQDIWKMARRWHFYSVGHEVFEKSAAVPTSLAPWGVWAILIDGNLNAPEPVQKEFQWTKSARRRQRRRRVEGIRRTQSQEVEPEMEERLLPFRRRGCPGSEQ